jgi:hypothetical protein
LARTAEEFNEWVENVWLKQRTQELNYSAPEFYTTIGGTISMAKTVSAADIQKGDVINVVFTDQKVSNVSKDAKTGELLIETREGRTVYPTKRGNVPTRFEMVKESKRNPAHWPPQANDVWVHDDGYGYKVYYHTTSAGKFRTGSLTSSYDPQKDVLDILFGTDSLTLAFRPELTLK